MKNILTPFIGTNLVLFKTGRDFIRRSLKEDYKEFSRNQFAENTTDFYECFGMFVMYDSQNKCDSIEFDNTGNLFLENVDLISLGYTAIRQRYDDISKKIEITDNGVLYHDLGFGVGSVANTLESIIVFSDTYWHNL